MCRHKIMEDMIMKVKEKLKSTIDRYLVKGLSGMALGLFSTLIVGLIIKQIGTLLGDLTIGRYLIYFGSVASVTTGAGIGIGVAHKLESPPLVVYSSAVTGLIGAYASKIVSGQMFVDGNIMLIGPGEPLGAFIAALIGIEAGRLIAGKTKLDIVITPIITIITGATIGVLLGPSISTFMSQLGQFVNWSTEQRPFIMGILVATTMGIFLTLPISSAAISIILGLSGVAAGAATVGCTAQMVGFAVASYRENKMNGLVAQGLGTSMLQIPNIVKNPLIWIPPILTSAILGPISTMLFGMENNAAGAGMGTAGLVGQIMTYETMTEFQSPGVVLLKIALLHFLLPAVLTLGFSELLRYVGWIKKGDMKLDA